MTNPSGQISGASVGLPISSITNPQKENSWTFTRKLLESSENISGRQLQTVATRALFRAKFSKQTVIGSISESLQSAIGYVYNSIVRNSAGYERKKDALSLQKFAIDNPDCEILIKLLKKEAQYFNENEALNILKCISHLQSNQFKEEDQKMVIWWSRVLKETLGEEFFNLIVEPNSLAPSDTIAVFMRILQRLVELSDEADTTHCLLIEFNQKTLTLDQLDRELGSIKAEKDAAQFPEKDLNILFREFSGIDCPDVKFPLSKDQICSIFQQYEMICKMEEELDKANLKQWSNNVKAIRKRYATGVASRDDTLKLLAIGRKVMTFMYGIRPYNTQLLTILGLLYYPSHFKGRMAQVLPGQGKSTIITLLAFLFACQENTVDIISSSRYLSIRDAKKYSAFFHQFDITVSDICIDNPSKERFQGQIIYGTNYDFEFAIMRDHLGEDPKRVITNKKGASSLRPFDVAIVDEGDNLFIDAAGNSARIATQAPKSSEWIYSPILDFVKYHLDEISLSLTSDLPMRLRSQLQQLQNGAFQKELKEYSDEQLSQWIMNAYRALIHLKEEKDYLIKLNADLSPEIVIVDWSNTGRLKEKSRWQGGVHQFLEAKHNLKIREEGLTVASIGHPVYFGKYNKLFSLTGTVGSVIERKEIESTYRIDSFDTPPHQKNKRIKLETLVFPAKTVYYQAIWKDIQDMTQQGRPVLVLCETIQETTDLSEYLRGNQFPHQVLNETQVAKEDYLIARAGKPGIVTIATNNAGRGTDIIPDRRTLTNGGLHVLITFLPPNERVEEQGICRGARQGQVGSSRMVICSNQSLDVLLEARNESIKMASLLRIKRIATDKTHHDFLEKFWNQLQRFYACPSSSFSSLKLNTWLNIAHSSPSLRQAELDPLDQLLKKMKEVEIDPIQQKVLGKAIQSTLGKLAQQYWALFFYNKTSELEAEKDIIELYNISRPSWESLFDIFFK